MNRARLLASFFVLFLLILAIMATPIGVACKVRSCETRIGHLVSAQRCFFEGIFYAHARAREYILMSAAFERCQIKKK